jgi:hypothetical protein
MVFPRFCCNPAQGNSDARRPSAEILPPSLKRPISAQHGELSAEIGLLSRQNDIDFRVARGDINRAISIFNLKSGFFPLRVNQLAPRRPRISQQHHVRFRVNADHRQRPPIRRPLEELDMIIRKVR